MPNVSGSLTLLSEWLEHPHKLGHLIGFKKLTPEHDHWVHLFLHKQYGAVRILEAHRGSYKTTCGLVAMVLLVMLYPNLRVLIARKSVKQASKLVVALQQIFESQVIRMWMHERWGVADVKTSKWNTTELRLSVNTRISPEPNFTAAGVTTGQTGDHYDYGWFDDTVTEEDRYSDKERDHTKNYIHNTEHVVDPTGIRFFSGTPWHERDGYSMLEAMGYHIHRFPLGSIYIAELTPEIIARKQRTTPKSLWAANMLLKHVRDTNPEFEEPIYEDCPNPELAQYAWIDGAFGGDNNTAIWIGGENHGLIYLSHAVMFWNIDDHWEDILSLYKSRNIRKFYYEDNGAQKLIGGNLDRLKIPNEGITTSSNKFAFITATLKPLWTRLRFATHLKPADSMGVVEITENTLPDPMGTLLEYNEQSEIDDSPDACAKLTSVLAGANRDFIGEFPVSKAFDTEYIVAFVATTFGDANAPDRTSVTVLAMVPNVGQAQRFLKIQFTGRVWDKAMVHPDVMRELVEFIDQYEPIEVCIQTLQDDENIELFVQRLEQEELDQEVETKNLWEPVIQSRGRHERIMMHVAGNKDRIHVLEGTQQEYLQSIAFYTKTSKSDVEADSLAGAIHRWQNSANLQNYIDGAEQLAKLNALE